MHRRWQFTLGFILILFLILVLRHAAVAQDSRQTDARRSNLPVIAVATGGRVRFTAPSSVVQMRLEVYGVGGEKLFNDELKGGNVLDWLLQNGQAERLPVGSYLCLVTVKSLSGKLTQRLGSVIIEADGVSLRAATVVQMTAQQREAIGPVEADAALTLLQEGEPHSGTVMAHDGEDGLIARGHGALSFRIGDFFSGKDQEQMRLTAEGNLGLGIAHPQVRLDVDGLIRATQGIIFPDGSIQYSAASKTYGDKSRLPGSFAQSPSSRKAAGGQEHVDAAGTGTLNFLAKWAETGGSGMLTNSAIFEANGNVGIGTSTPQFGFEFRGNNSSASFTRDIGTAPVTVPQSALQLGLTNVASRSVGIGPSFLFFGDNSAGAKSFLGRVSGGWENPAAGSEAGAIFFQVRANSADTTASTERMRITAAGNVGIGTGAPAKHLHVFGASDQEIAIESSDTNGRRWTLQSSRGTSNGRFEIIDRTANNNRFTISDTGNVGIGTTGPENRLQVAGAIESTGARTASPAGNAVTLSSETTFDALQSWANRPLVLNGLGNNVGIGTTAPAAKLHIADNGGHILFGGVGCGSGFTGIAFGTTNPSCANASLIGDGTRTFINAPSSGQLSLSIGNVDSMRIDNTGDVEMLKSLTIDRSLGVWTSIYFGTLNNEGGSVLCYKPVNNGATTNYFIDGCGSSIRLKKNINLFNSGMSLIKRLRPVSFDWKSDGMPDVGLIAEEVDAVEPLLATRNNKGEVAGVKYEKLPVVLINAVKEQQAQIEQQDEQIKTQQALLQQQQAQSKAQGAIIRQQQAQAQRQESQLAQQRAVMRRQQSEIDALKRLFCASHPRAAACQRRH